MGSDGIFKGTIPVLEKALDLRSRKHNLLVSNIANKDTPNYKASDLSFEREMEKLIGTHKSLKLSKTCSGHIGSNNSGNDYSDVTIIKTSQGLAKGGDGNTVDIEKEMTSLAENHLLYDAATQIIRKKLQGLKVAIQGGK